jgi:hypothetical protein
MLPAASFFAPWWLSAIDAWDSSWQLAQIGVTAAPCAMAGAATMAEKIAATAAAKQDFSRILFPLSQDSRRALGWVLPRQFAAPW